MKKFILILAVLVLIATVLVGVFRHKANQPKNNLKSINQSQKEPVQTLEPAINGSLVKPEIAFSRPVAVMVENHPDARPQSGLNEADIVYEAPTEGGITRFLAVYQTKQAKSIGPVRSARVYFVAIADELGVLFAHVGGNSDALANIRAGQYKNIANADQFFADQYFERVKFRPMPHNVYTSIDKLKNLIQEKKYFNQATYQPWQFKDDALISTPTASNINVNFSTVSYAVRWLYDETNNSYARFLANKPHKDLDTGKQIIAKNIIVQFVETSPSKTDTLLSIDMDLTTGGKATVFLDGKEITGTWKKTNGRTRYYNQNNQEMNLNRGVTWVELVPVERAATVKN